MTNTAKPALPEPVLRRWRWRTFEDAPWHYSAAPEWADERLEIQDLHPAEQCQAAINAAVAEARAVLECECDDTDKLLRGLGLDPERCRTEGGSLNVGKTLTLLAEARAVPEDFLTHHDSWRQALSLAAAGDSDGYWQHELRAFDAAYVALSSAPSPAEQPKPAVREAIEELEQHINAASIDQGRLLGVALVLKKLHAALQGEPHDQA